MKYIDTEKVIIKSWCDNPEQGAIDQAKELANLPVIFKQVCLMPDVHQGWGMPIGGVIACNDSVISNAVGVDIGCGMIAVRSDFTGVLSQDLRKQIMSIIRREIPMGMGGNHKRPCDVSQMPVLEHNFDQNWYEDAMYQLGTLGSGNHFLEMQVDEITNNLWIMIHSGSRNLGKKICDYYNKAAREFHDLWFINSPKDLAWLPVNSDLGHDYIEDMNFALDFAFRNRMKMLFKSMEIVQNCIEKYDGAHIGFEEVINIHHNYASLENHFGRNVWVHRKGATLAREGTIGIIPGSQGTHSYIVKGKGNPESFMSCSHGAGRSMSRSQAVKNLNLDIEKKILDDQDIVHSVRNQNDLDEAVGSYKDIELVMKEQSDLVEIIHTLRPIAVLKG